MAFTIIVITSAIVGVLAGQWEGIELVESVNVTSGSCSSNNMGSTSAGVASGEASRTATATKFTSNVTIQFYFTASK